MPELLTFKEVAKILKVSPQTVARYTKRQTEDFPLKFIYLNPEDKKEPRVKISDLKEFMQTLEDDRNNI